MSAASRSCAAVSACARESRVRGGIAWENSGHARWTRHAACEAGKMGAHTMPSQSPCALSALLHHRANG
jgi:hypothetical protein